MYALVTGASAGIGMEMAKYLGTLGYDLILSARSEDRLEQTRRVILARYSDRSVHLLPADLSNREECFRLYREASTLAGDDGISFVANNAGMGVYGLFLETDLEKELDLIDLNVTSVHILSKLFLRDMVKKGRGVLLNVGSCAGFMAGPTFSSYYASKNYVVRLTEAIHEELRRAGSPVKVSCLCPGPTDTAFNRNSGVAVSGKQISAVQAAKEGVDGALQGKMIVIPGRKMPIIVTENTFRPGSTTCSRSKKRVHRRRHGDGPFVSVPLFFCWHEQGDGYKRSVPASPVCWHEQRDGYKRSVPASPHVPASPCPRKSFLRRKSNCPALALACDTHDNFCSQITDLNLVSILKPLTCINRTQLCIKVIIPFVRYDSNDFHIHSSALQVDFQKAIIKGKLCPCFQQVTLFQVLEFKGCAFRAACDLRPAAGRQNRDQQQDHDYRYDSVSALFHNLPPFLFLLFIQSPVSIPIYLYFRTSANALRSCSISCFCMSIVSSFCDNSFF